MSKYPGEDSDIPQRILDTLGNQPLNHLVPKDGLASLISAPLSIKLPPTNDPFVNEPFAKNLETINDFNLKEGIEDDTEIIFKRLDCLPSSGSPKPNSVQLITNNLSPLATKCLQETNPNIIIEKQRTSTKQQVQKTFMHEKKHKIDTEKALGLTTNDQSPLKKQKMKTGTGVPMNQLSLGQQYIKDLVTVLECIGFHNLESERGNLEYWISIDDGNHILTENILHKLQITLKNIMSVHQIWDKLEISWLQFLLNILTDNIEKAKGYLQTEKMGTSLLKISHLSAYCIFQIFLFNKEDKKLHLERYLLEPINFISEAFELLKLAVEKNDKSFDKDQLSYLDQSISLLPSYVEKRPYMDENLVTKLIYIFTDTIMNDEFEFVNNLSLHNIWKSIKTKSCNLLITLFLKIPSQREFILQELLTHTDRMPQKRIQRKLTKVANDTYITDFTRTIIGILESINCFDYAMKMADWDEESIRLLEQINMKQLQTVHSYVEHINSTILKQFLENTTKYRHVLNDYVQDLLNLIPLPEWSVTEVLLSSMTKKLLLIFDPTTTKNANTEAICLQTIGNIGSVIFNIKSSTNPSECDNLIKIFNYPEKLPQLLEKFQDCLEYIKFSSDKPSAFPYFWNLELITLLKLREFNKDSEVDDDRNNKVTQLLSEQILKLSEPININTTNKTWSEVKLEYYSILHTFDLLNLYEPYLKLILSFLGKDRIKLRSTAIKCLSMLANKDPVILQSDSVKETIQQRLNDSSASVKDAILDLVSIKSSYLQFYRQINANFADESISVRRHVLRINEKIYDETTDVQAKIFVASRILLRIEDEEDIIIDMAKDILLNRWILSINALETNQESQATLCNEVILIISGVISLNAKCSQLIDWFLNFYLLNETMHTPPIFSRIINTLNLLADYLVQGTVELQLGLESENHAVLKRREEYLALLTKFSDSTTTFITKNHLISLYPYLVSDEKSDLQYYILRIFKNAFQKSDHFKPKFLFDLETTLLSRLPKMNVKEIEEAMPLIWQVCSQRQEYDRASKACSSCFVHLNPYITMANKEPSKILADGKLQRLIYLTAGFARFCPIKRSQGKVMYVSENESIYEYVTKCLLVLSKPEITHIIRRIAIKNLTKLCGSYPKLFNSKHVLNLLDKEFNSAHLDIKLVILESFYDFFVLEEKKSVRKAGVNGTLSSELSLKQSISMEKKSEFVNDGVCSALVSRFLKNILDICTGSNIKSSLVAVRLLELILQYGYTNPSHAIPIIIALVSSNNQYMSHISIKILKDLFEKYETMVFSGMSKGVQQAIVYSRVLMGDDLYKNDLFLRKLGTIVGIGKKYGPKFIKTIKKVMMSLLNGIVGVEIDNDTKDSICFMTSNIANLQFNSQFDLISLLKPMDVVAEQMKENIQDWLATNEHVESIPQEVKNSMIIQSSLIEVKNYMFALYNIKVELLELDVTDESELKNRPVLVNKTYTASVLSRLEKIIQSEDILSQYINF
ncbi:cohesin-loading factor complex subunit SCC2 NDAI_0A01120 [Naumovozyma dairenensis CBS 421]|uniref:Sister chromatid cohesion protein n=1 Tax=Naumovozyma dairenensis (strain ATCC 10597 / BCRC 20456 / CBS 421 / NBRC 0211 / NRRL Y-12639) TaxID=1071378 RepID=G0W382_NAUDC|nr:hypothetical protein NDAI_0A01120 [Naumovozyma dairenensis CBS 421]CCD22270.1 hypothetical protein NDAI_0A01120 [Naumovozyma dairenensis CBS 421]